MRALSSIPWDHLKVGDIVISAQELCGEIIDLIVSPGDKYPSITIRWDREGEPITYKPHSWTTDILYVGRSDVTDPRFIRQLVHNFLHAQLEHKIRLSRILDRFCP